MIELAPDLPDDFDAIAEAFAAGELNLDAIDLPDAIAAGDLGPDDFALDSQLSTRIHAPARSRMLHPRLIRYENAQRLADELGPLSDPGARAHAILNGNFIYGDFLEAWIKANNWLIPDAYLATLSLSHENLDSLANLLHGGYIERLHLMVSDYWFAHERRDLVPYAYQELDLGAERFQLSVTGSHCKLALLAPVDDTTGATLAHHVLHGSANLRSSASIEQLAIEHDRDLYDFHRDWLTALERQYSTIHPNQPGPAAPKRHQWQQIAQDSAAPTTPANATPTTAPKRPTPTSGAPKSSAVAVAAPSDASAIAR